MRTAKEMLIQRMNEAEEAVDAGRYSIDRAIDETFGYLRGVCDALDLNGEEFEEMSRLWTAFHMSMHPAYKPARKSWREVV